MLSGVDSPAWVVKLDFVGADPAVQPVGRDQTDALISYFRGPHEEWQTGLRTYARVIYQDLWPGIDLHYSGTSHPAPCTECRAHRAASEKATVCALCAHLEHLCAWVSLCLCVTARRGSSGHTPQRQLDKIPGHVIECCTQTHADGSRFTGLSTRGRRRIHGRRPAHPMLSARTAPCQR
jgi:hypothetical protein